MFKNLMDQVFGRLKVKNQVVSHVTKGGNKIAKWLCVCDCGREKVVSTNSLTQGKTSSCGCLLVETARDKGFKNKIHGGYSKGLSADERIKFQALQNIKDRSRRRGYESDLELHDLPELTKRCPVLDIEYKKGSLKNKDFVPSVDRKNTNLPYLKKYRDNLVFISHRANRIKSDATIEELLKVIQYMKEQ